jgi:hypothetical protein
MSGPKLSFGLAGFVGAVAKTPFVTKVTMLKKRNFKFIILSVLVGNIKNQ